jgi:hypothetical protein
MLFTKMTTTMQAVLEHLGRLTTNEADGSYETVPHTVDMR